MDSWGYAMLDTFSKLLILINNVSIVGKYDMFLLGLIIGA